MTKPEFIIEDLGVDRPRGRKALRFVPGKRPEHIDVGCVIEDLGPVEGMVGRFGMEPGDHRGAPGCSREMTQPWPHDTTVPKRPDKPPTRRILRGDRRHVIRSVTAPGGSWRPAVTPAGGRSTADGVVQGRGCL